MGDNINPNHKVSDFTVVELKKIIQDIVTETMENFIEDREALLGSNFQESVKEAREEYKEE